MRDREPDIGSERLREVIRAQTEIVRLGLDLSAVMTFVAERAQRITGAHGAVVELAEGEEMVYRAASGILQNHIGLRLQRSGSLTGLCVEKGFALRCEDSESDPRVDREACRRIGLRSMIVVPLRHDDAVAGVLKVKDGVIVSIYPWSGHYRSSSQHFEEFVKRLQERGLDTSQINVTKSKWVIEVVNRYGMYRKKKDRKLKDLKDRARETWDGHRSPTSGRTG